MQEHNDKKPPLALRAAVAMAAITSLSPREAVVLITPLLVIALSEIPEEERKKLLTKEGAMAALDAMFAADDSDSGELKEAVSKPLDAREEAMLRAALTNGKVTVC